MASSHVCPVCSASMLETKSAFICQQCGFEAENYSGDVDADACDEDCPCGCEGNRKQCVYSCLDSAQQLHQADVLRRAPSASIE